MRCDQAVKKQLNFAITNQTITCSSHYPLRISLFTKYTLKRSFLKIIQISLSDDKKLNGSFTLKKNHLGSTVKYLAISYMSVVLPSVAMYTLNNF